MNFDVRKTLEVSKQQQRSETIPQFIPASVRSAAPPTIPAPIPMTYLVRLWDTATGNPLFAETGHTGKVTAMSFTSDGRTLVSGAEDGTLRVWDIAAARLRRPLTSHRGGVHALAVAANGKKVLSGGADGAPDARQTREAKAALARLSRP